MQKDKLSVADAKNIGMVEYLEKLGHSPNKVINNDYWYLSPFRAEKTPSFKVNRKMNVWYDHGLQKGGTIIDFGILFYQCKVIELLFKLGQQNQFSFHPRPLLFKPLSISPAGEKEKIIVTDARPNITLLPLREYLASRKIPLEIANRFCKEVDFNLYDKKYTVIGFQNNAGGFELRNANFKGSSRPKDVTLVGGKLTREIVVFEGFMDFLSYQSMNQRRFIMMTKLQPNFLVLNSIGFMEKMKPQLEKYPSVHLYLDHDKKGLEVSKKLLALGSKYQDESRIYKNHKDLNDYLVNEHFELRQSQSRGRRL